MEAAEFLRRMRAGERPRRAVMEELYPELTRRTQRVCRRGGLYRPEDIDDVLQETCVKILQQWQAYRGDGPLWGWIFRIARNCVIDHHRYRGRFSDSGGAEDDEADGRSRIPEPSHRPDPAHEDCVARVLDTLNAERPARAGSVRTIDLIEFVMECGTDTTALAQFLDCRESGAKERKSYALMKIRDLCSQFCGNEDCAIAP